MKCIACLKSCLLESRTGGLSIPLAQIDDALTVVNGNALCIEHAIASLVRDDEAVRLRVTGSST